MKSVTFVFKFEEDWVNLFEAINDTMYTFASTGYKEIKVWGETAIETVRNALNEKKIKYSEK